MTRAAASLVALYVPKETSHNPLMIVTRATTLCFFSVVTKKFNFSENQITVAY